MRIVWLLGNGHHIALFGPYAIKDAPFVRSIPGHKQVQTGYPLFDVQTYSGRNEKRHNRFIRIEIVQMSGTIFTRSSSPMAKGERYLEVTRLRFSP